MAVRKALVFCCFLLLTVAYAQVTIEFKGNKAFDDEDLLDVIQEQIEAYREDRAPARIDEAARKLQKFYRGEGYGQALVEYKEKNNGVSFSLDEGACFIRGPVAIIAEDGGKLSFKDEELQQYITPDPFWGEHYFTESEVKGDVEGLKGFYKKKGYLNVAAKPVYHYFLASKEHLFTVGANYQKSLDAGEIPDGLRHEFAKNGNELSAAAVLKPTTEKGEWIIADKTRQFAIQADHGLQVHIPRLNVRMVKVSIAISEGARFHLSRVRFQGRSAFSVSKLEQVIGFSEGMIREPALHQKMLAKLKDFYRSNGYARVKVDVRMEKISEGPKRKDFEIYFTLKEGTVHCINEIRIHEKDQRTGENLYTAKYVIGDLFVIQSGDIYDIRKIRKSERNLQNTMLFREIQIKESYLPRDKVDLVVLLSEDYDSTIKFSLGYSTYYLGMGGIELEWLNFFGTGRQMRVTLEGSFRRSFAELRLIDPWFLQNSYLQAEADVFALYDDTPSYEEFRRGGGLLFRQQFSRSMGWWEDKRYSLYFELGYRLEWSEIINVETGITETEEGTTLFSSLSVKAVLDLRDHHAYPTFGTYSFIEYEPSLTALKAEIDYSKIYAHTAWYLGLMKTPFWVDNDIVLALVVRGGVIMPFGNTDTIPIQKRFFGGGANSVRSFKEKEMPPLNTSGNPVGGEGIFIASAEIRVPIYSGLGISLFGDMGQIMSRVRTFHDYRINGNRMRYAAGGSLWYLTPFGPIRFDYGYNTDRESGENTGAYFISIGFSF